jgi:sugar phosphate isomerase/epimerase
MYYTGFADEAATDIDGQIRATKALGWQWIEARSVNGVNLHDLAEADFEVVCGKLKDAGIGVNCFGSAIANWAKKITDPFEPTLAEARRAIPRMQRLGAKLIRVMSYPMLSEREPDDQFEGERFKRLRTLQKMFADAGLTMVHENCMNYGGMGWTFTQRLLDHVPGLKLVFDTGNPLHTEDFSQPKPVTGSRPRQSSWEFYDHVRDHVVYLHIKDAKWDAANKSMVHTWPGEGEGDVRRVIRDLLSRGYDDGLSIEPHLAVVAHDPTITAPEAIKYANYLEYGRRAMRLIEELRAESKARTAPIRKKRR